MNSNQVDYKIVGDDMQAVIIELDPNEGVVAEAGAMNYMDYEITMDAVFGDGSDSDTSMMGKIFSAGKRVLSGASLFMTLFHNIGQGKKQVAFAAPYPGKIIPVDLTEYGNEILCQKDSFLCAAKGTQISIAFTKRFGVGFFGGEGFILQKLNGDGLAFIHAGGTIIEKTLNAGELLKVDTGCIVAMTNTIDYNIEMVKGIKTALFGGEGLFFATLKGPGKVWIQTLPFSRMASRIVAAAAPHGKREEGSVLGPFSGMFDGQ
jgi:uncharacterized protein (TIGR00266 family)